jgi:hypothetical protein
VTVGVEPGPVRQPNDTLGGHPARVVEHAGDGGRKIMEVAVDYGDGRAGHLTAEGAYDAAAVRDLATAFEMSGSANPADWPTRSVP